METYQSPMSSRYGTDKMRHIWSEYYKRFQWRQQWYALLSLQAEFEPISDAEHAAVLANLHRVDLVASAKAEERTNHALAAELQVFASQCAWAGKRLHIGATSSDIEDRATFHLCAESYRLIRAQFETLVSFLVPFVIDHANEPCVGYTHLQAASLTTIGYRFAVHLQEIYKAFARLDAFVRDMPIKPFAGAVGTQAVMGMLYSAKGLSNTNFESPEDIRTDLVCTQTSSRVDEYALLSHLAVLGTALAKMAMDIRLMESDGILFEVQSRSELVGSSAMAHKTNPIECEKTCSLARGLVENASRAGHTAMAQMYERTLDDSAGRRSYLPESFIGLEECLRSMVHVMAGLQVNRRILDQRIQQNLNALCVEYIQTVLISAGVYRADAYQWVKEAYNEANNHLLNIWDAVQNDARISAYWTTSEGFKAPSFKDLGTFVGTAPRRAAALARKVREHVAEGNYASPNPL